MANAVNLDAGEVLLHCGQMADSVVEPGRETQQQVRRNATARRREL